MNYVLQLMSMKVDPVVFSYQSLQKCMAFQRQTEFYQKNVGKRENGSLSDSA